MTTHTPYTARIGPRQEPATYCQQCGKPWPCDVRLANFAGRTVLALQSLLVGVAIGLLLGIALGGYDAVIVK